MIRVCTGANSEFVSMGAITVALDNLKAVGANNGRSLGGQPSL